MLLEELSQANTSHQRRLEIGEMLAKEGDTRPGAGLDDSGLPDMEWCPVEAGTVVIEETPFQVDAFFIAKYPVTHSQYQAFLDAKDGYRNEAWWQGMPVAYHFQELSPQRQPFSNHPRDSLSWYQALAFSRWMNAPYAEDGWTIRLPLEWEWQQAAQGYNENREFAFGNWQENHANTSESGLNRSIAVGMYPHGQAVCGAMDMTGNVWEWCLNDYEQLHSIDPGNEAKKVRRGGSFKFPQSFAKNNFRDIVHPYTRSSFNGMRLVRAKIPN